MKIRVVVSMVIFMTGQQFFTQLFSAESIELYNKNRDYDFISNLVKRYPAWFPEAYLLEDLDSPITTINWPDKDGGAPWVNTYEQKIFTYIKDSKPVGFIRMFNLISPSEADEKYAPKIAGAHDAVTSNITTLQQIAIAPEYQRQGIGKKLLAHVISETKKSNKRYIILNTMSDHTISRIFFEKLGFTKTYDVKSEDSVWGDYCWYALHIDQTK